MNGPLFSVMMLAAIRVDTFLDVFWTLFELFFSSGGAPQACHDIIGVRSTFLVDFFATCAGLLKCVLNHPTLFQSHVVLCRWYIGAFLG